MRKPLAIVNPAAAGGRAARRWPALAAEIGRALGGFDIRITAAPGDATRLAAEAVAEGRGTLIAVGGDGTLHEVANGIARATGGSGDGPALGIVNWGSGGDFCRSLGIPPGPQAFLRAMDAGRTRAIDLGRIAGDGAAAPVWFINIANAGFSGEVTQVIARSSMPRRIGPKLAYLFAVVSVMRHYRGRRVLIGLDGAAPFELDISTMAIANGRYFGSGMHVAPMADPGDGLLDLVVFLSAPKIGLTEMRRIYDGSHVDHPAVRLFRAASIRLTSPDGREVLTDADGEPVGALPATVDCRPAALRLIC